MTLTRDQLRAARMLLHLRQEQLAELSEVGIATIKRFETGNDIRPAQAAALREALEEAGIVLVGPDEPRDVRMGLGVALRPTAELPPRTLERIAAEGRREAQRIEADKMRRDAHRAEPRNDRPRGRPVKRKQAEGRESEENGNEEGEDKK